MIVGVLLVARRDPDPRANGAIGIRDRLGGKLNVIIFCQPVAGIPAVDDFGLFPEEFGGPTVHDGKESCVRRADRKLSRRDSPVMYLELPNSHSRWVKRTIAGLRSWAQMQRAAADDAAGAGWVRSAAYSVSSQQRVRLCGR